MVWVQDHGGDWVNLASCFSLTIESVSQPDGVHLYQLHASSGSMLYAVLVESPDREAVQLARDTIVAHLETVPASVLPTEDVTIMSVLRSDLSDNTPRTQGKP